MARENTEIIKQGIGIKSIVKEQIFIYQMPEELGGDWAASSNGIISDGFKSREDAEKWALEQT